MTKPTSSTWRMSASQSAILARGPLGRFPSHESADKLRLAVNLAHLKLVAGESIAVYEDFLGVLLVFLRPPRGPKWFVLGLLLCSFS